MQLRCCGSFCQGSMPSKYPGFQCTMIALFALAFAYLKPCTEWNMMTMNSIVQDGNSLYTAYVDNYMNGIPQFLAHDQLDILNDVQIYGSIVQPTVHSNLFYGAVGVDPDPTSLAVNLNDALEIAFQLSNHVLITVSDFTVGAIAQNGQFYIFDSHARNHLGQVSESGTSVLLMFDSVTDLSEYFRTVYNNQMFNISPVQFASEFSNMNCSESRCSDEYKNDAEHNNETANSNSNESQNISEYKLLSQPSVTKENESNCNYNHLDKTSGILNDSSIERNQEAQNIVCGTFHTDSQSEAMVITVNCSDGETEANNVNIHRCQHDNASHKQGTVGQTEYLLQQPNVITVQCDDIQRMLDPFVEHNYHYRHANLTAFYNDHGYYQNGSSDFCGLHYLPYEKHIQEKMNHYCHMCCRLLFKENCKMRIDDGIKNFFCSTCYIKSKNGHLSSIAWSNNMDPGSIPKEIKDLRKIEHRFIALIHVFYDSLFATSTSANWYKRYSNKYSSFTI